MKFRKLRIAWSVTCGIACVLLVVLWVRSYWNLDYVEGSLPAARTFRVGDMYGLFTLELNDSLGKDSSWKIVSNTIADDELFLAAVKKEIATDTTAGFGYASFYTGNTTVSIPMWLTCVLAATLAVIPWIRWRFTLRALLIATTLVAIVLGLIVWSVR